MGRITVFALTECPHCKRTKSALTERGIAYTEISLSTHPNKRTDMLALADRLTVPQVFFNDKHIGGADDTLALLKQWDEEAKYSTPLERYQKEIEASEGPLDPRLAVPTEPPVKEVPPPPRPDEKNLVLPSGEKASVLEVTEQLKTLLSGSELRYHLTKYKNAFVGADAINALKKLYNLKDDTAALKFGLYLQEHKLLDHVTGEHKLNGDKSKFFRLTCFNTPAVLNSYRVWTERVDPDSMSLLKRLKKLLGKVESEVLDDKGLVAYNKASDSKYWPIFEEAVCELQGVDMGKMPEKTRLAFGINLYNVMIKYAFMKVGIGSSSLGRSSFFSGVKMDIGGDILSFNDLENGVLRGNKKPPFPFSVPFADKDPRKRLALKNPDCRIHFALNCGAKSCPPVKNFTVEALEEELRIVAQAFCEQEDNVRLDEATSTLYLTKILDWYKADFADSKEKLPAKIVEFLRGDSKTALQKLLDQKTKVAVKYNTYDWGTNASTFQEFDSSAVKPNQKSIL